MLRQRRRHLGVRRPDGLLALRRRAAATARRAASRRGRACRAGGLAAEREPRLDRAGAVVAGRDDVGMDVDEARSHVHPSDRGGGPGYSARR